MAPTVSSYEGGASMWDEGIWVGAACAVFEWNGGGPCGYGWNCVTFLPTFIGSVGFLYFEKILNPLPN